MTDSGGPGRPEYLERYRTPWWYALIAAGVAAMLGLEFAVAVPPWAAAIVIVLLLVVCVVAIWRLGSSRLSVSDGRLVVPAGELDLAVVERAVALSPTELRRLVGRHSDPRATVFVRPWVGPGVQLVLNRGTETPYWLVSTRTPRRLLEALQAASVPVR